MIASPSATASTIRWKVGGSTLDMRAIVAAARRKAKGKKRASSAE
jgi:hypothetical protein